MTSNPILDEIHAVRRQLLARYNGDLSAYLRDAQARLEASGRPIANLPQRSLRCPAAAELNAASGETASSPPGNP